MKTWKLVFVYTHWDKYLKDFLHKALSSPVGRPRREEVDWEKRFEEKKSLQDQRHEGFQESLSRNGNKRRPSICGQDSSAILIEKGNDAEALLEKNITDKKALTFLFGKILKKERESGQKFRVTDVFGKDGRYLGYLHLRGGSFTVNCIKPGEHFAEPVSEYTPMGWYDFMDERERSQYLSIARRDIAEFYRALEKNHQYP